MDKEIRQVTLEELIRMIRDEEDEFMIHIEPREELYGEKKCI